MLGRRPAAAARLPAAHPPALRPGFHPHCPAAVPPDGGLTLRVQLFGGLTNVTYVDEVLELLPGNVKWSVLVDGW